ncbi:MAG: hypothetical protein Alpg2KO_22690 [Alphaproteobacteria bacterium]
MKIIKPYLTALPLLILLAACATDAEQARDIPDFPGSERDARIEAADQRDWPRLQDVPNRTEPSDMPEDMSVDEALDEVEDASGMPDQTEMPDQEGAE